MLSRPRAQSCVLVLALLLAVFPASLALGQDAPPLEADGAFSAASKPVAPRPISPRPAAGKPLSFKPGPSDRSGQAGKPGQVGPNPTAPTASAPAASAQAPARPKARGPAVKDDGKRYLRSRDENHDGRISREEFLAGTKKRFAAMDQSGDGVVSAKEAQAAKAKLLERKAKSDARRKAQGKPQNKKSARVGKGDRPAKPYLSAVDANQDGRVTRKEYLVRREKKFAELDLNHDGVISKEEAQAAKAKLLKRRAERKAEARQRAAEGKGGKAAGKGGQTGEPESQATAQTSTPASAPTSAPAPQNP